MLFIFYVYYVFFLDICCNNNYNYVRLFLFLCLHCSLSLLCMPCCCLAKKRCDSVHSHPSQPLPLSQPTRRLSFASSSLSSPSWLSPSPVSSPSSSPASSPCRTASVPSSAPAFRSPYRSQTSSARASRCSCRFR